MKLRVNGEMMEYRPATLSDAKLLFEWRNDPLTRKNSCNTHKISWEEHLNWFHNAKNVFIALLDEKPIGTIRFEGTELSWTISPDYRNKRLSKPMVLGFVKKFLSGQKVTATIREGNIASEKIAIALGLHRSGSPPLFKWS